MSPPRADPGPNDGLPGEHALRREILGEVHARPFAPIATPRRLLHFAYLTDEAAAAADMAALAGFSESRGGGRPPEGARHFAMSLPEGRLRWERHTEFISHSWDMPIAEGEGWAGAPAMVPADAPPAPGQLVVALELLLVAGEGAAAWGDSDTVAWGFEPTSLCVSAVDGGAAMAVTDFQVGGDGFSRILVRNLALDAQRAGAVVRRLIEIEVYRSLALLTLPMVRQAVPVLDRTEAELVAMLRQTTSAAALPDHKELLAKLTDTASTLEALKSEASYRLAAARAYEEIVRERLEAVGEIPVEGHRTWAAFLGQRIAPAMRTCASFAERQESLSTRLGRAADLLRTRVDIALEAQNNAVLRAMNRRSEMQLRLQQTVEGLSVAAVSYYVVGLVTYLAEGGQAVGLAFSPAIVAAVSVPVVIASVWWIVRRVRRRYVDAAARPKGAD